MTFAINAIMNDNHGHFLYHFDNKLLHLFAMHQHPQPLPLYILCEGRTWVGGWRWREKLKKKKKSISVVMMWFYNLTHTLTQDEGELGMHWCKRLSTS